MKGARGQGARVDGAILAGLALALVGWFLWPYLAHGYHFPLGPDGPVYLWWTRLAGQDGLSAVGLRAGVPALSLVAQAVLGRSVVQITAALEVMLAAAVGLACGALLRGRTTRVGWILASALAGTFSVHLAAGYLANLLDAMAFLAAAVALAEGTRRGAWVAAGLIGAGGLAHPLFFLLGVVILALTAGLAWRADRNEVARVAGATLGGAAIVGAGVLSLLAGPAPLEVDTSRDAFLRRAGLAAELRGSYRDRFVHRWTRYVQWASVPLAAIALGEPRGFVGRFLRAWALATVAGVAVGLITGWFPPDRFITFGFVVPILAALGLERVRGWLAPRRAVAVVVVAGLAVAMLAGAFIAWNRQEPFLSADEVEAATIAGDAIAGLESGTPLAFLVNDPDETATFLATRAGNVIRAAIPPDRIRDVVAVVPPLPSGPVAGERQALEHLTAGDLVRAEDLTDREAAVFVLTPFDAIDAPENATVISPDLLVSGRPRFDALTASSPGAIAWSSVLLLAFVSVAGYGWARVASSDPLTAAALAPAAGSCALVLVAVALERVGLPIETALGAWVVSAVGGGGGYVAWRVLERRPVSDSAP